MIAGPWPDAGCFTIGHSTQIPGEFVALLRKGEITLVVEMLSVLPLRIFRALMEGAVTTRCG